MATDYTKLEEVKARTKPQEILLVVDAMTGQDAVRVADEFNQRVGITGLILTKVDGDARGGAAISVRSVTGVPIKFMGVGEKPSDLEPFIPDRLASRILGMGDVLTLLEERKLTEGHGRALLSAPDHDDRRRLAHDAVTGGWSVRTTEERARAAAGRATTIVRTRTIHPDQLAAAEQISETLSRALGTEIRVNPVAGGYRASFLVDSPDAAQALANRVPRGAQTSR